MSLLYDRKLALLDLEDFWEIMECFIRSLGYWVFLDSSKTEDSAIFSTEYPWLAIKIAHFSQKYWRLVSSIQLRKFAVLPSWFSQEWTDSRIDMSWYWFSDTLDLLKTIFPEKFFYIKLDLFSNGDLVIEMLFLAFNILIGDLFMFISEELFSDISFELESLWLLQNNNAGVVTFIFLEDKLLSEGLFELCKDWLYMTFG